ncbi:hypothetical protein GPJ56_004422 [Histomonas meleagridis]|uniref:uncharacterized protein n=1 Tax=Histomonas meleagridis TaxID=135588 RepID=UPI00355A5D76|nr:hypothetical protein GPJ56_004422 [Histomonas meleagridis]KAH0799933.1 hypothetical protein GO595_007045 [Histomonas meleagridis]
MSVDNANEQHVIVSETLEKGKELFRRLWMKRTELERQIDMERDLQTSLQSAHFKVQTLDIDEISQLQTSKTLENGSLLKQIKELSEHLMNNNETTFLSNEELEIQIEELKKENDELKQEIDSLTEEILNFDDNEIHLLRAEKQHLDLLKMGG